MNAILRTIPSHRLTQAAAILLSVILGLMWLIASITAPSIAPFETTDQPIQPNFAQAPDRPGALSSAAGRTSADYWSEVGKAAGAF